MCIEELNSLPVVQQSLQEQLKTGIKGLFNKEEQRKVISGVCLVNRVAYDVTQTVSQKEPLPQWPMIDTGKEKFDLLRDRRVTKYFVNRVWRTVVYHGYLVMMAKRSTG